MKTKGFLICFTGIDGTGKTTLSKELVELLNKRGFECRYVYGKLIPFILKPFITLGNWIFLRGRTASKDYSDYSQNKHNKIKKYSFLSSIYQKILLFDYVLQISFKVKLPLMFGKNIVCDRYIYDTIVTDLAVDMSYSRERISDLLNHLLRFFPKPDIAFLIDVKEEIAYHRKDDTPSLNYLKERRGIYLDIGKEYDMVVLDGTKKIGVLKCEIENEVMKVL